MSNCDNPTQYIKKLIRIIYEKENQIENLKRTIKKNSLLQTQHSRSALAAIDEQMKSDIDCAATQLKEVSMQMTAMETKIYDLQNGLDDQSNRNASLEEKNCRLEHQIQILLEDREKNITKIINQQSNQNALKQQNASFLEKINFFKNQNQKLESQIIELAKASEIKAKMLQDMNYNLKNYEEFAFEIQKHIDSAYIRYCTSSTMRSSKKILKYSDDPLPKISESIKKFISLEHWMNELQSKLEKMNEGHEEVNETVEGLSLIVKSFEEKLQICHRTQRQIQQDIELNRNEELLLDNLEKQWKNEECDRTKLVELNQIKEVLKVTKDVNRQLMDEINKQDFLFKQCLPIIKQIYFKEKSKEATTLMEIMGINKEKY